MESSIKNSSASFFDKINILLLVFAFATFSGAVFAQNINDDLKPKTAGSKTPVRKTSSKSKVVRKPASRSAYSAPVRNLPAQTPAQILERFTTNYQQSAGVTANDWQNVVSQTGATLQGNPNNTLAKMQLAIAQGQLFYGRGDYSNALTQFNSAAQILPNSPIAYYCIGKVYLATRQPNEARSNFEKAIKLNGNFALAYRALGDTLAAQGRSKQAQDYYAQAARFGGSAANSTTSNRGKSFNRNQPAAQTEQSTVSAYEAQISNAKSLTARKKWQDSLNILNPISRNNQSPEVFIAIGDNYFGMKQWLSAQQAYQKAINLNPNSALAMYKMGMVMFEANEFQAASDAFEKSLILDQSGSTIDRQSAREMADKASEKAKEMKNGKKRKFLGIGIGE